MDTTVIGWSIYYGDGRIVSSKDVAWKDAPSEGVQVLIVYYDHTYTIWRDTNGDGVGDVLEVDNIRDVLFNYDYYWFSPTKGYGCTQGAGIPDDAEAIKLGKELDQPDWRRIYNLAQQATRF